MKNKFIILTLCFTIIFTNINLSNYKSYADSYQPLVFDGGIISAPVVATISTIAVASGVVLNSNDDVYDVVKYVYSKYKHNKEQIDLLFDTCVSIGANKVVSVGKDFVNMITSALDDLYINSNQDMYLCDEIPKYPNYISLPIPENIGSEYKDLYSLNLHVNLFNSSESGFVRIGGYYDDSLGKYWFSPSVAGVGSSTTFPKETTELRVSIKTWDLSTKRYVININGHDFVYPMFTIDTFYDLPYSPGYDSSKLKDKDLDIYVPGSLDSLVGGSLGYNDVVYDGTLNPPYELPLGGVVTLPGVSNPSIDVGDGSFADSPSLDVPGTDSPSVPDDSLFEKIKDFIISLVVPSDSFWTDTFNSFRDNLSKNFPMLDMSGFDSLLVNGKPFPNIYAFGSIVVNGDIINSIVDWLRPIIAGFIMICLMFFNYRKVYKTIRNSEPFGNIAPGTSDFSTGLSSQDIKQIVADAKRETERRTYRK